MNAIALQSRQLISFVLFATAIAFGVYKSWQSGLPVWDVREVSAQEAQALMAVGAVVIDVRDKADSDRSHLPGALLLPIEVLEARMDTLPLAKTADIVVYCGNGSTLGPRATTMLNRAGYSKAVNLKSGYQGWSAAGLPTARN